MPLWIAFVKKTDENFLIELPLSLIWEDKLVWEKKRDPG